MARKKQEIQKPLLCRRCEVCGEWWIAKHPKDDETKCERRRGERESDGSKETD